MFYDLLENEQFNFQINRILTYGEEYADLREIRAMLPSIRDVPSWTENWRGLAEKAKQERRYGHAMYYYRLAEFYLTDDAPEKNLYYAEFKACFGKANEGRMIRRFEVPFEGTFLPAIRLDAENPKGTLLVHGGYDSFMEEFFPVIKDCVNHGYSLVMFEGPGQGQARKNGLTFRHDWEVPTSAVIDFFHLDAVNLLGISWGGYLAPRAAAFDARIKNVICYDVFYRGLDILLNRLGKKEGEKLLWLLRMRLGFVVNGIFRKKMAESIDLHWKIKHGMYITGTSTPYGFLKSIEKHTMDNCVGRISQNVLLLAGERDQYVPVGRMEQVKRGLKRARSVSSRMFTAKEGGDQHCQVGNLRLVIDELYGFLDKHN